MAWKRKAMRKRMPRKRRGGKGKKTVTVNRALQPIPQRYIAKLKYTDTTSLATIINSYKYRLNSLYDPDFTGSGHQPYGFDQLAALYNRYRVISCSYSIVGYNSGAAVRILALPANESISPATPSAAMESPRCKWVIQNPGGNTQVLKGKVYIPSLVGRNKTQYLSDDRYQAQVTANPDEAAILNLFHANLNDTSYPSTDTNIVVTLHYTVEFFDVKQQSQS